MKCPHCGKDIKEHLIIKEAARIAGRRSKRRDQGGQRCGVHGVFLRADGKCPRCLEREQDKQE